jgi:ABC-type dipeptide/oligopeptide/nickel transport system permease subunit
MTTPHEPRAQAGGALGATHHPRTRPRPLLTLAYAWHWALFALAVLAPLLASGHPILLTTTDPATGAAATEYPLLRFFTRTDWLWLIGSAAVGLTLLLIKRRVPLARTIISLLFIPAVVLVLWFVPRDRPEVFDYASRATAGSRPLYTLIPFSPSERPTDRDARFLPPGASTDGPLARNLRADLLPDQIVNARDVAPLMQRLHRLPIPQESRDRIRARLDERSRDPAGLTAAAVEQLARDILHASGRTHLLGTDRHGQDLLSRLLHGCRLAATVGLIAAGIATLLGVALGALMGYIGGWIDLFLSRLVEIVTSLPLLFILVLAAALLPRSLEALIALIACFAWPAAARYTRAEFLRLRNADFALAARAAGLPTSTIIVRHLLPNAAAPVIIDAAFTIAAAIVIESTLGYLGLGPAGRPSWGTLLADAVTDTGQFHCTLAAVPAAFIFLTALSYNIIGENLRDRLDPRP